MKKLIQVVLAIVFLAGFVHSLSAASGNRNGAGAIAAAAVSSPQATAAGQKTLRVMPGGLMSPLFITRVSVDNRVMMLGTPISARHYSSNPNLILNGRPFKVGGAWLNDMTLYIKNRTDKPVASATVLLSFPETGNGHNQPMYVYHIRLGRIPAADAYEGRTGKPLRINPAAKPLNLKPGQEVAVHVADYIDGIKAYVEKAMPLYYATTVGVSINACTFTDGLRYSAGAYSLPDPSHHGKWKYLPSGYFPGDPHQFWPPGS